MKTATILALGLLVAACGGERPAPPPAASPEGGALPRGHPSVAAGPRDEGAAVSGTVTLAPRLAGRSGAALYLIARDAKGAIVAVRKEDRASFPFAFRISGADAMTEGTAFVGPFDVTARLSKSGDAMPGKGDVEGSVEGVTAGTTGVEIVLDSVRQ